MSDYRSTANFTTSVNALNQDPLAAKANTTVAYTDGACKGNPGAGGWGAHLIFSDGRTQDLYGGEAMTTNNRMELMGAIKALEHSSSETTLEIWTDSSYVKNGITDWIDGWKNRGWKTAGKKPVANQDLWQQLDALRQNREVEWHWVKGHAGHAGNEKADELANLGVTASSEPNNSESKLMTTMRNSDVSPSNTSSTDDHTKEDSKKREDSKKKASAKAPTLSNDDWLNFDPLGLDDFEDDEIDDLDETDNTADFPDSNIEHEDHEDELVEANLVKQSVQLNANAAVNSTSQPYQKTHSTNAIPISIAPESMGMIEAARPTITDETNYKMIGEMADKTTNTASIDMSADNSLHHLETPATDLPKFDGDTSRANPHFQPLLPKPIHRNESNRQLIMDTETTGLDALKGDRIIEVGIVEMVGRKFTGEKLHVYINPQRGMDEEVIRIHGISEAFLTDKPTFDKVAQSLYDFMDGAEIIAHNASFDMNFLNMEFGKVGLSDFAERVQVTDSLLMAKQQYPGQKNTLDALVRRLNVGKQDRTFHGALLDSEILAEVYLAMTGGQVSLGIEEDSNSEGGQTTHAHFAHLAALLLETRQDDDANRQWFTSLAEDYPEMGDRLTHW